MPHGNAVIDGYGVELGRKTALLLNLLLDNLSHLVQMGVAGHKLRERVDHGYYRTPQLLLCHAVGTPQGTGAGHAASLGAGCAS